VAYQVIRRVNAGTIVGLWIGIAAYFWANRLLPVDMVHRAGWEVRCFFIAWGLSYLIAVFGKLPRIWPTLLALGCALFALLPLLNIVTTSTHLGNSLVQGNWVYAVFDLSMLAIALLMGIAARVTKPA
jgi:hypothetical protein